jgi:hypothetical protein
MTQPREEGTAPQPTGWRMGVAMVLIVLSLTSALLVPVVASLDLPAETKATISGLLVLGIPQVLMFLAVALVGKPGFQFLKARILGAVMKLGPPRTVGPTRYRIGLVLFVLPLLLAFVSPYASELAPELGTPGLVVGAVGDLTLLVSLFVLGGDFWDKLRSLFVYEARARFPAS